MILLKKMTNNYENDKELISNFQDGNESFDKYETSHTLRDDIIINTTK